MEADNRNRPKLLAMAALYVVVILLCNMNNNAKPIQFNSWLKIYLADLTIPLIWLLKDGIQKRWGKETTKSIIKINVLVNIFIYLWASLANATAPDPLYAYLSGSVLMFVCSMAGFYVSENLDTYVYSIVNGEHVKKSLISNVASVPVDSLFACLGLKLIGVPTSVVLISLCVQIIMKLGLPGIFYLSAKLAKGDNDGQN